MNVLFISPNFPTNYWQFCSELKKNGVTVLGIGDAPYDQLRKELRESLTEYYKVSKLENYGEVYRAVAFLIFKHGKIDWLESNNEYWLEQDAKLRTAFHITSGFQEKDIDKVRHKSLMKKYYKMAGVPTARYCLVRTLAGSRMFAHKVGYPVIVKPDNGVGASSTYKIRNDEELLTFYNGKDPKIQFIMEEFVPAVVNSYDAIVDSKGEPIFETGNVTPVSIMDIVNEKTNSPYYIVRELPEDTRKAGRSTLKAFGVKSRFVHFEFFRLTEDFPSMGRKGDIVALEVNMRPCGGFSPDMMDFANSTNVYKIWADMIAFDRSTVPSGEHFFCPYAGRRDGKNFVYSNEEIQKKYGSAIKMSGRMPEALADAMGNFMYIGVFRTEEEMNNFYKDVFATV